MIYVTGKLGLDVARVISFPIGCREREALITMAHYDCGGVWCQPDSAQAIIKPRPQHTRPVTHSLYTQNNQEKLSYDGFFEGS